MELRIENISKQYGDVKALDDLSFTITEGIYGFLGANGAGKSTLMNLITDNVKREKGNIYYNGKDILELGAEFRKILGYMPQQQGFYEQMTARGFMLYVAYLKGLKRKVALGETKRLLEVVNLTSNTHKRLGGFSGGMKQRLLLAATLLGDPKILILDEPTAGLDPKERVKLRNFIEQLSKDKIILIATHVVSDIESIADKIIIIKGGHLLACEQPADLVRQVSEFSGTKVSGLEDVYMYYFKD